MWKRDVYKRQLLYRMNDLEFFDLGIYEFEQQLINCVGKPSRCNKPASQVIQALDDKMCIRDRATGSATG